MCFVDLEKAFVRIPKKVFECGIREKGMPIVEGAETRAEWIISLRVKVNSVLCLQCGKWNHG